MSAVKGVDCSFTFGSERILFDWALCIAAFVLLSTGETASNLGTAMDELMRHQPTLKTDAMTAIIKVDTYTTAVNTSY